MYIHSQAKRMILVKDRFYLIMERAYGSISNIDIKMKERKLKCKTLTKRYTKKGLLKNMPYIIFKLIITDSELRILQ
jgi:hypothetical protein